MKKIIVSLIASTAIFISFVIPTATISAAEFISIGTGGPTGVYFVVGNSQYAVWFIKRLPRDVKVVESTVYDVQPLQQVDQIII